MTTGRKAIPNNIKVLTGNPGKRPINAAGSILPEVKAPPCPAHLNDEARAEWHRVMPELIKIRIITELDMAALAAYCVNYARWAEVETKIAALGVDGLIDQTPSGFKQMHVLYQISNRCTDAMHKFAAEFGMTPATRAKVEAAQSPAQQDLFSDDKPTPSRFFGGR